MTEPNLDCASHVIRTFPALLQAIITEMDHKTNVSFQQFRALMFIAHQPSPNLSMVGEHMGATLSATSKLVDGLIQDGYVASETALTDRRIKLLSLTPLGKQEIEAHHQSLMASLAAKLDRLTESECAMVALAMDVLQSALHPRSGGTINTGTSSR